MGFTEVLTIVFVILKATGHLDWSWWLVFSPELIAGVLYALGIVSFSFGLHFFRKPSRSRTRR